MKKLIILGTAAAAIVATPVLAQMARGPQAGVGVTRQQAQARVRDAFIRVDRNRDGRVTRAEANAFRTTVRGERRGDRQERKQARFARLDANRDRMISRSEFFARPARADRGDRAERRRDRMERRAERRALRQERRAERGMRFGPHAFERMDANRDGRVTLAEATRQRMVRFDRVDVNRDGRITRDERRAFRTDRRNNRT